MDFLGPTFVVFGIVQMFLGCLFLKGHNLHHFNIFMICFHLSQCCGDLFRLFFCHESTSPIHVCFILSLLPSVCVQKSSFSAITAPIPNADFMVKFKPQTQPSHPRPRSNYQIGLRGNYGNHIWSNTV